MGMNARLVTMHGKADDVLLTPFATSKVVGVLCPLYDALLQNNVAAISIRVGSVYRLVAVCEFVKHIMVTTEYHADSAVGTIF